MRGTDFKWGAGYHWPGMAVSRKIYLILCLPEIFYSNLFFAESSWGFKKILLAALDLACITSYSIG